MPQGRETNGQTGLVILLIAMIGFGVYQFVIAPMLVKEAPPSVSNGPTETEEERINRIANELYLTYSLSMDEESILTTEDRTYLNDSLTLYKMSDVTKLYLGFKNIEKKYLTKDNGYRIKEALANANGNYYYEGTYVMVPALEESIKNLFGDIEIQHQTITLDNAMYVYKPAKNMYEVWTVKKKTDNKKVKITFKEIIPNNDELYIYEYVAYTDVTDPENIITSTIHNSVVEVIITEENVQDCLNYMDKYRYVFQKQQDGSYTFKSIDFIDE